MAATCTRIELPATLPSARSSSGPTGADVLGSHRLRDRAGGGHVSKGGHITEGHSGRGSPDTTPCPMRGRSCEAGWSTGRAREALIRTKLHCVHDCRRFCRIFHWTVCRTRMGITCEPYCFFVSLFRFSLGGLDICGVDDRTKEGQSGCGGG
jgi:hypothetical protein